MQDLKLSDLVRYTFSPFILFFYLYLHDSSQAKSLISDLGTVGAIAFAVAGTAIYFLYRYLVYESIIKWLHDVLRRVTYRTYLGDKLKLSEGRLWLPRHSERAERIFKSFRIFDDNSLWPEIQIRFSGIHFLYQGGIIAIPFIFISIYQRDYGNLALFASFSVTFIFAATLQDMREEDEELTILKSKMSNAPKIAKLFGLTFNDAE